MNKSIEKILVDIIQHELDLPANYGTTDRGDVIPSVIIYSQNIKLHNTDKLQVTVRTVSSRTYSNRNHFEQDLQGKYWEIQDINQSRMMQIDCYSRNNDARDRHQEITMALNSIYAQQQMDLYNFKIGTLTNDVNISGIDGGSDINRFTTSFNVIIHFQKKKEIDYYDKFRLTAETEKQKIIDIKNY